MWNKDKTPYRTGKYKWYRKTSPGHGRLSLLLAAALLLIAFESGIPDRRLVRATEADAEEETVIEEDDPNAGLLNDTNGWISFWKWNKVTPQNYKQYFNDDKFHAAMMVYFEDNESAKKPKGFISLYGDKQHIYRGSQKTQSLTGFDKVPGTVEGYIFRDNYGLEPGPRSMFFLLDEEGQSLNDHKEYFQKDSFFTTGGSMGVLWLRLSREIDGFPYINIALSRAEMKNDPDNESCLDIGTGRGEGTDYIFSAEHYQEGHHGVVVATLTSTLVKNDSSDMSGDLISSSDRDHDQDYRLEPWRDDWSKRPDFSKGSGWRFSALRDFTIRNGWLVFNKITGSNFPREKQNYSYYFEMYVGTQYVFASLKGEGGDATSGKGSTITIKKNQMKVVMEGNYSKPDGTSGHSDGVVLPETSRIVIEEGGELSVEGNFINNGTIINKGGTIIVKDGGCISPFTDTKEGRISCIGGTIIVMPKGKLFCLVDDVSAKKAAGVCYHVTSYDQDLVTGAVSTKDRVKRSYASFRKTIALTERQLKFERTSEKDYGDDSVTPVSLTYHTAEASGEMESGTDSKILMTYHYRTSSGVEKTKTFADMTPYIQDATKKFQTGRDATVKFFLPEMNKNLSIISADILPYNETAATVEGAGTENGTDTDTATENGDGTDTGTDADSGTDNAAGTGGDTGAGTDGGDETGSGGDGEDETETYSERSLRGDATWVISGVTGDLGFGEKLINRTVTQQFLSLDGGGKLRLNNVSMVTYVRKNNGGMETVKEHTHQILAKSNDTVSGSVKLEETTAGITVKAFWMVGDAGQNVTGETVSVSKLGFTFRAPENTTGEVMMYKLEVSPMDAPDIVDVIYVTVVSDQVPTTEAATETPSSEEAETTEKETKPSESTTEKKTTEAATTEAGTKKWIITPTTEARRRPVRDTGETPATEAPKTEAETPAAPATEAPATEAPKTEETTAGASDNGVTEP